jgi:hypothetical protein
MIPICRRCLKDSNTSTPNLLDLINTSDKAARYKINMKISVATMNTPRKKSGKRFLSSWPQKIPGNELN